LENISRQQIDVSDDQLLQLLIPSQPVLLKGRTIMSRSIIFTREKTAHRQARFRKLLDVSSSDID